MAEKGIISRISRKGTKKGAMAEVYLKSSESKYLAFSESYSTLESADNGTEIEFESRATKDGDAYYLNNVKIVSGAVKRDAPAPVAPPKSAENYSDRGERIELQTFYKVAGMSGACKTPDEVTAFANKLKANFERDLKNPT